MLELTEEQHRAVEAGAGAPRLIDPLTKKAYILLSAGAYDRLRRAVEEVDPSFYEFDEIESG